VRSLGQVRTAVARLQRAAKDGGHPPLLVAVDQEGGTVKRLTSLPPSTSPAVMARRGTARREGARTAAGLRDVGVNLDLAPVADVPRSAGSFLGTRAFGRTAGAVADAACAFSAGLRRGGVLPTLKHFPGLGAAGANTDFADVTIRAPAAQIRAGYEPYRRCANDGLVMIANARYPRLTGSQPAVLARATYARELRRVGFTGVTISDDLQADGVDPIADLAVKASAAGLDIALYAKTELAAARAFTQIQRALRDGRLTEEQVRASAARVAALKEDLGS
jgi:beta-N-acetylhexosaminidase